MSQTHTTIYQAKSLKTMQNITKQHFKEVLTAELNYTPAKATAIVNVLFDYLQVQMARHKRIELRGTIVLEPVIRRAKKGQIIKGTGTTGSVDIPKRKTYKVKVPKELILKLNQYA